MTTVIYMWQVVWLLYGLTTFCRRVNGRYFYSVFPVLPPILYIVFSFSLACYISWLLIWDREYMEVALVFINLMACTLFICLVVTLRSLHEFGDEMFRQQLTKEIWFIRIFVQNGLALFASLGAVAALFNFTVVMTYCTGANQSVGSIVSLTFFTMEIVAWWICDNFVFDKLLRYIVTPYLVFLMSLLGIIQENWDPISSSSLYTASLLSFTALLTFIKLILIIYREKSKPIFNHKPQSYRPQLGFEMGGLNAPLASYVR